jgi:hypothetical protein
LYDEQADPNELHNLAGEPGHDQLKKQLKQLLAEHAFTVGGQKP